MKYQEKYQKYRVARYIARYLPFLHVFLRTFLRPFFMNHEKIQKKKYISNLSVKTQNNGQKIKFKCEHNGSSYRETHYFRGDIF